MFALRILRNAYYFFVFNEGGVIFLEVVQRKTNFDHQQTECFQQLKLRLLLLHLHQMKI